MNRLTGIIGAVAICIIVGLVWLTNHYYDNATEFKRQRDEQTTALNLANDTIIDMQTRQRDAAALDAKYTGELADAKATIETLRDDVATGKRRLHLNASCPKSKATGASRLGDASSPRLDNSAERDYFTLRERINTITKQVSYLQDYIRQQCLK